MRCPVHRLLLLLAACGFAAAAQARVTRIMIDEVVAEPVPVGVPGTIAYERIAGRAFGALDPNWAANAIIQDIARTQAERRAAKASAVLRQPAAVRCLRVYRSAKRRNAVLCCASNWPDHLFRCPRSPYLT